MSLLGKRIKQARLRARASQRDVAGKSGVSATAISKYETGKMKPGSDVILKIADALDVDVAFFLRPERVTSIKPAYRKLKKLSKTSEYQLIERIRDWLERYLEAEDIVEPKRRLFVMPEGFPWEVEKVDDAEPAAEHLRQAWDLGSAPIENLTLVLEHHGIRVGLIEADEDFDACTFTAEVNGGLPVMATRRGVPGDRQRFSLAHELGHLLLSFPEEAPEKMEEHACNRFAGALLAPREQLLHDVGDVRGTISKEELLLLKHNYGISMRALTYRFRDAGITTKGEWKSAQRAFTSLGWHVQEPGEPVTPEEPQRFRMLVLRAVAEDMISERRARELLGSDVDVFTEPALAEA